MRSEEAAAKGEARPAAFRLSSRHVLRDFLDVRDAVRAYGYILDQGETGKIYRIDSGAQRELGEIAGKLLAHAAVPVEMDWGPQHAEEGQAAGSPASAVPVQPSSASADREVLQEEPEDNAAVLGWKPGIGLDRSLADIIGYTRAGKEGRI